MFVKITFFVFIPLLIFLNSCSDSPIGPKISSYILDFVEERQLPKSQKPEVVFQEDAVTIFKLKYGEAHDCPSGCFYSIAYGMLNNQNIGWLYLSDYEEINIDSTYFYNYSESDSLIFSESYWVNLNNTDSWLFNYALLPSIARDKDTPLNTLLNIISYLYDFINPNLGLIVLSNENIINSSEALEMLSKLPVYQGDPYENVRNKALELLNEN